MKHAFRYRDYKSRVCASVLKISKYVDIVHYFWEWGIPGEISFIIRGIKRSLKSSNLEIARNIILNMNTVLKI